MMLKTLSLIAVPICASIAVAQVGTASLELKSQARVAINLGGKTIPTWHGQTLFVISDDDTPNPSITLVDRQGRVLRSIPFRIPGASRGSVFGYTGAPDSTFALTGAATDSAGRGAPFVAWVSGDSQQAHVVRTGRYFPFRVAIAPDGSIWTAGFEMSSTSSKTPEPSAPVFRHFDRSGKELGALVMQSEIDEPQSLRSAMSVFGAYSDRIIWYSLKGRQLIELSPSGTVTKISGLALPNGGRETGFAITGKGELFVSSVGQGKWSISKLDRNRQIWVALSGGSMGNLPGSTSPITLFGADGDMLVGTSGHSDHLQFYSTVAR